jgi:Spy/CpxP family protein refolding chaperone
MRILQGYRELLQSLDLTEEQQGSIRELMRGTMEEMRGLQDLEPGERMVKARELFQKLNGEIREKLTDEQKTKFDAGLKDLQQRARNPSSQPTSRPFGLGGAGGVGGGLAGRQIQNFRSAIESLDLTEDQKKQVAAAFDEARAKMKDIDPGDREAMGGLIQELREKLTQVLTPEQREALQKKMQEMRNNRGGGQGGPGGNNARGGGGERRPPPPPSDPNGGGNDLKPLDAGPPPSPRGDAGGAGGGTGGPTGATATLGQPAPELSAMKLDGTPVRLSSFKGRTVVLVFGSLSAPTFREKAKMLNDLIRDFRSRFEFHVIYTAEAFPVGTREVERNKDEKVRIEPHASLADRQRMAQEAKTTLKIEASVLTDDMKDRTAQAYDAMPNGAVVIGRDGKVVLKQKWFDAFALRRKLEELGRPSTRPTE